MKNTFCQKKWVETAIPALSSDQSNLQTPIWGCHRQLDDQNRNPIINNRDHLAGQLPTPVGTNSQIWPSFISFEGFSRVCKCMQTALSKRVVVVCRGAAVLTA